MRKACYLLKESRKKKSVDEDFYIRTSTQDGIMIHDSMIHDHGKLKQDKTMVSEH